LTRVKNNKYLRSVGKKERIKRERVTGKDRYTPQELFLRCQKLFMFRMGEGRR
jgi:hypothetical protein